MDAAGRLMKSGHMNRIRLGGNDWPSVWRCVKYWIVCAGVKYIFRLMPMKRFLGGEDIVGEFIRTCKFDFLEMLIWLTMKFLSRLFLKMSWIQLGLCCIYMSNLMNVIS